MSVRNPIPIYRNHDETFEADSCQPLVEAVSRKEVRLQALVHGHYPGRKLAPRVLVGMKTVGYWDAEAPQLWGLPWHRNEGIEITFLESGKIGFAVDDCEYALQPDALTVTRPWQRHRVGNPNVGPGRLHWIILDVGVRRPNQHWRWPEWIMLSQADRDELANVLRQTNQPIWKASGEIRHCFLAIAAGVGTDQKHSSVSTLTVRINELLLVLLALLRKQKPRLNESLTSSKRTVELFLEDLSKHPEHQALEWTVQEMANSCGLGLTQFVHVVKQLTNMTPLYYLNRCRLELAGKLLRERRKESITDVALACGFSSSQYFATVFSRRYGCSPTEFKANQRSI